MKKMNLVAIMLIIAALFTAGCLGGDDESEAPTLVIGSFTETTTGFCGNPQVGSAEDNRVVYAFEVPAEKIVVAYKMTLTWSDDMQGSSDNDIYDVFELKAKTGDMSEKEDGDTGEITIVLGTDNFGEGNESASMDLSQTSLIPGYTPLDNSCEVTITMKEGGWEDVTPRGRLISYDTGNSWSLALEAIVMEDPNAVSVEPVDTPEETPEE